MNSRGTTCVDERDPKMKSESEKHDKFGHCTVRCTVESARDAYLKLDLVRVAKRRDDDSKAETDLSGTECLGSLACLFSVVLPVPISRASPPSAHQAHQRLACAPVRRALPAPTTALAPAPS